jgi:aspartyl-tRNA(Asn)/glutamyl-tRNA(Gln) amidotransferase subunit A
VARRHDGTGDPGLRPPLGAGQPSVAVPCGFTDDRLPVAFQVIGRPFDEATILKVARSYEALTDWTSQAPPI